jgi:lipopolysaccharide transport system ATP-binding protein
VRTGFTLEFEYWNFAPGAFLNPAVLITNEEGIPVLHTAPLREPAWHGRPFPVGLFRSVCRVPGNLLNDGAYRVALHIVENEGMIVHREEDALTVQVLDDPEARGAWHGAWPGVVRPELDWATELVDDRISAEPIL